MGLKESGRFLSFFAGVLLLGLSGVGLAASQDATSQEAFSDQAIPQPQGFCGYCHILTYPDIFNHSYDTWKKSKHNEVGCVECHYPPGEPKKQDVTGEPAGEPVNPPETESQKGHIPAVAPGHFSRVELGGDTIRTMPQIVNASCTTAACHGKPEDDVRTKKIKFAEKVSFVHEPHLLEKNQIEGQKINCTSCHQVETAAKHFEVSEATCFLCHFNDTKFNEGRAKCELCHQLPVDPIKTAQTTEDKAITHKMLQEGGVNCGSCHYDLLQGSREAKIEPVLENGVLRTALFVGAGQIKEKSCATCHEQNKYAKEAGDKKVMHDKHVTTKSARCFDCHLPIEHRKGQVNQPLPGDCAACHSKPHRYQRLLVAGPERQGVPALPDRMYQARTNCMGCHIDQQVTHKGQTVMKASAKSCIKCHSEDYEKMFGMWEREVGQQVDKAQRLEKEALQALEKYRPGLTQEKLTEAGRMLKEGRENLNIVQFGKGIHNTKYSIALLDVAISSFKNMIGYLEGKETEEAPIQEE